MKFPQDVDGKDIHLCDVVVALVGGEAEKDQETGKEKLFSVYKVFPPETAKPVCVVPLGSGQIELREPESLRIRESLVGLATETMDDEEFLSILDDQEFRFRCEAAKPKRRGRKTGTKTIKKTKKVKEILKM